MVLLMALATGLVVASNYYAQPLLHTIGAQFHLSEAGLGSTSPPLNLAMPPD
jgi:hypothetical protein